MKTNMFTPKERFDLVMECRNSGLTDRQWCLEHGIPKSTFYHWIAQFRKNGFPNVPEPQHRHDDSQERKNEVVKLQVLREANLSSSYYNCESAFEQLDRNDSILNPVATTFTPVAEICVNGATLKISNNISPEMAGLLLRSMRGSI